jgi:hypothetical protein
VFGGKLTALRYPERELMSVSALRTYNESAKPFLTQEETAPALSVPENHGDFRRATIAFDSAFKEIELVAK